MCEFVTEAMLQAAVEGGEQSTGVVEAFMVAELALAASLPASPSSPTLTLPQPFSLSSSITCAAFL